MEIDTFPPSDIVPYPYILEFTKWSPVSFPLDIFYLYLLVYLSILNEILSRRRSSLHLINYLPGPT